MKNLSTPARAYVLATILIGLGIFVAFASGLSWNWRYLLPLALLASFSQILKVEGTTQESSFNISWLFYGFTFFLLGPEDALLVIVVSHLVEWVRHRYPWYIQAFNIANFAIAIGLADVGSDLARMVPLSSGLSQSAAAVAAITIFTLVNHLLVGTVLLLARGKSFRESGILGAMTLMIDLSMFGTGGAAAFVWGFNPYVVPLTLLPIALIYNTLKVPALQRKSEVDPKTGLYNAKRFSEILEKELARAQRFGRDMTLVMGDLDLLRNINNTYGHLAGDVVLIGVANIMKEMVGDAGTVARFGGEEFAILLPETTVDSAYPLVENIRKTIETAGFEVTTSITPINATISFGVAGRAEETESIRDLIHNADIALYQSKTRGRNATSMMGSGRPGPEAAPDLERPTPLNQAAFEARIEHAQSRYRPNPIREPVQTVPKAPVEGASAASEPHSRRVVPWWAVNAYIGGVGATALFVFAFALWSDPLPVHWPAIAVFAAVIILFEALSIEIYVKETSISTSGAVLLAGVLMYGPEAAFVLSTALALTAKIKHHSPFKRFIFNLSNHLLYSSLITLAMETTLGPVKSEPILLNAAFTILFGYFAFFSNTALIAGVIGLSTGGSSRNIWKTEFRWLFPYYVAYGMMAYSIVVAVEAIGMIGLVVVLIPLLILRLSQVQYIDNTRSIVSELRQQNAMLEAHAEEIQQLNDGLMHTLADIADMRDSITLGHTRGVNYYVQRLAKEMRLTPEQTDIAEKAALLHDVGKFGIPEALLFKPGPLTEEEYEQVKQHSTYGAQILSNVESLKDIVPVVKYHHEWFDGSGYPDGLSGTDIPIEARILSLADAVEAMASDRPYRQALDFDAILEELRRFEGTQFDPLVVEAFFRLVEREGHSLVRPSYRMNGKAAEKVDLRDFVLVG